MIINKLGKKKKISRYTVLVIILGIILGAIAVKLLIVQVYEHDEYTERANTTSTRLVSETAPRGEIYDSNGVALATNKRTYSITYTETDEANKKFYATMDQLFDILDESGESIEDKMILKLDEDDNPYFEFSSKSSDSQNYEELRFKKDRGLDFEIQKELFPDVEQSSDLSEDESEKINEELLKITPEETFYKLVKNYNVIELISSEYTGSDASKEKKNAYKKMTGREITQMLLDAGYSLPEIRKSMLVRDTLKIQGLQGKKTVTIGRNIKKDTILIIEQKLSDLPGIGVSSVPIRYYPYDNLASSVLGYVSSISSSQKDNYELRGYDISSDLIGITGIESAFEDQLKGVKGGTTVKVNSTGRVTEKLFEMETHPGNNIHLTIDSNIQYAAEQSLKDGINEIQENVSDSNGYRFKNATRGALVAVEVKTGRILALANYPDYNPNLFAVPGLMTTEEYDQYFHPDLEEFGNELIKRMNLNKNVDDLFPKNDKGEREDKYDLYPRPTYNYATQSLIPPGSTFKPLTAIAGLESGVITPSTIINDTGVFNIHPDVLGSGFAPECLLYHNNGYGHGPIDVAQALQVSCNFYFYETAFRLYEKALDEGKSKTEALDSLAEYAWQFGLGVDPNSSSNPSTGIELSEKFGQTYNFYTIRRLMTENARFDLANELEKGDYKGMGYTYVPFDFSYLDQDTDEVREAKKTIKDKISEVLSSIETDDWNNFSEKDFTKEIKNEVLFIMNNSKVYKQNVADYEDSTGKDVNIENQANIVSEVITRFTFNDKPGEIRSPGQLISASIGQGINNFTPLQLVSYISTIANGGTRYRMHLVDKITDNDGNTIQQYDPQVLNTVKIDPEVLAAVKDGMSRVNNEEGGTATAKFQGFPIKTAGKTGTADFRDKDQNELGRAPYATYVSFAPCDTDPEIAVVAVVFDGGHGGAIAGAVRAVYEAYFKDRILAEDPDYASKSESFKKYVIDNPNLKKDDEQENSSVDNNMATDMRGKANTVVQN